MAGPRSSAAACAAPGRTGAVRWSSSRPAAPPAAGRPGWSSARGAAAGSPGGCGGCRPAGSRCAHGCRASAACRTRRVSVLRVQAVEEVLVLLVDHVALDLQRRGQLAGLLGEVVVEDRELLDLLNAGVA